MKKTFIFGAAFAALVACGGPKAQELVIGEVSYEGEGLLARAFCHETDHLDGVLFKDNVVRMLTPEEIGD